MLINFEYGQRLMKAELPDNTDIFIPGVTVPDPPYIPNDYLIEKTRKSIINPIGMEPLNKLAFKGAKCVIVFPDRVKGGEHIFAHRKVSIPIILEELYSAGVRKKDILLICSNGLHCKNTDKEILGILGKELFDQFWYDGQIINHDSEDMENLIDLGCTCRGDPVIMNKYVYEADVAILIGHVQGNPYGGYSGGYKHCATGITHWRSIASHHAPGIMHKPDFVPVSGSSLMRTKFDEIGMYMESKMGKKFFCCDAVLDTNSRQVEIFSGYAAEMEPLSWKKADERTYVHWAEKKYDILVFGMPQCFHYGNGMGTNPVMLMQAISAQIIRHKRILSKQCVIICSSMCNGFFNEKLWPYLPSLYEHFQEEKMNTLPDLESLGEYFATNKEYINKYRFENAYHPFHGFSMISCCHIAEMNTSAIYIVGAEKPGYARGMGLKTRATFEEALKDAMDKFVGKTPNILALPETFIKPAVHICMKNQPYAGTDSIVLTGIH